MAEPVRWPMCAWTWTVERGAVLVQLMGNARTDDGHPVVIPMYADTLRAMVVAASGGADSAASAAPLIPMGSPERGRVELLHEWLTGYRVPVGAVQAQIAAESHLAWAAIVRQWLDTPVRGRPGTQHHTAIDPPPAPPPAPIAAELVPEAVPDQPAGLDGWPQPDPSESAALWQIRRVRQLLGEMAAIDPIALKGQYPTDLRDWVDRLTDVIRHYKRIERKS